MEATLNSHYRKTGNRVIFVFFVTGTKEELAEYKKAQGENYRENDDKIPLWFSSRAQGCKRNDKIDLIITINGNVVADDLDQLLQNESIANAQLIKETAKLQAKQAMSNGGMNAVQDLIDGDE